MKISSLCILTAFAATPAAAWTMPKPFLRKAASVATATTIIAGTVFGANAAADFNGSYSDPFHPNCLRVVSVSKDPSSSSATLTGTDGNPGCPADGSGKEWTLTGKVDGDNILVDFSPKGGPKDLKGLWDGDGIRWPDGNKWSLKK